MVTLGTICSGIGAPEKALTNLGLPFELVYFCEIDKHAEKSFCAIHNQPPSKNLVDLTEVDPHTLPKNIDLVVGGTPCQDFSVAGHRAGGDKDSNTRSSLMWCFVEVIRVTQPKTVLWENVPGCLSADMRSNYKKFMSALAEIGYRAYAKMLNAKDFGVPQNRNRVFVLAIRKDIDNGFRMPTGYDCGVRLVDILESTVDEKYYLSDQMVKTFEKRNNITKLNFAFTPKHNPKQSTAQAVTTRERCVPTSTWIREPRPIELTHKQAQGHRVYDPSGTSVTLSALGGGLGAKTGLYACAMRGRNPSDPSDRRTGSPTEQRIEVGGEIANALTTVRKDSMIARTICLNSKVNGTQPSLCNRIYDGNGVSTAITTSDFFMPNYTNGVQVRKLTPRECFRLMGFTDSDFDKCQAVGISDSQLYKQAGNSIVVNVLMAIFGELYGVDWQPLVFGPWHKTEQERLADLPLLRAA